MKTFEKQKLKHRLRDERRAAALDRWPTAGAYAQALDPTTKNPRHLQLIDAALRDVVDGNCERQLITMPPQEGKSERTSHYGVEWMLMVDPELRIAIASYEADTARRWGRVIRDDLETYQLPIKLREDNKAAGNWQIEGHRGGVYCVGVGGALTGRAVDMLVIDDPIKDRVQADSETYRENVWNWWTDVARTRLAPNAPVILILTRWHADDIAGRILASEGAGDWRVLHIPAQCDDPATDPLGRAYGEYLRSARDWPDGRWDTVKRDVGSRAWHALYQGKPSPEDGDVWLRRWWQRYTYPLWTEVNGVRLVPQGVEVVQSWDMSFKDVRTSDFVVGQVWAQVGGRDKANAYLLDQVRGRMDFPATCKAVERMSVLWPQSSAKYVEDSANGPAVISQLKRTVPGLIAVKPDGSKMARAAAVAPFIEAGNVWIPSVSVAPWVDDFVEEGAAFPNGVHDDQVDAASQALAALLVKRRASILL